VEEYEYRWDREFAITRVCFSVVGFASIFGIPTAVVWLTTMDRPLQEALVVLGWIGLSAGCAALYTRKYWKRLSQRGPQLELRRDCLRAAQLGERIVPWSEVVELRGQEEVYHRDVSSLTLVTTRGNVTLNIAGLDAPMAVIIKQAEAVALASRTRDSD
jgi:hypothetical protein